MAVIDKRQETIVKNILIEKPSTRTSDDLLWLEYIRRAGFEDILNKPFQYIVRHGNELGIPKRSSVSRARRKVQERIPELKDETIDAYRAEREEAFREYARS